MRNHFADISEPFPDDGRLRDAGDRQPLQKDLFSLPESIFGFIAE